MAPDRAISSSPSRLLAKAQQLVAGGTPWRLSAERLEQAAVGDRIALGSAVTAWRQVMHRRASDDFDAINVLRALERAKVSTLRAQVRPLDFGR